MAEANHNTKYGLFVARVTEAMENLTANVEQVSAKRIYEWVRDHYPEDVKLLDPSWGSHMSSAVRDENTKIRRVPGRFTYHLLAEPPSANAVPVQEELAAATEEVQRSEDAPAEVIKYTKRESALYPTLRDWLSARGFQAEDTSRYKAGGTWGNPDVTGIRIAEGFVGYRELEIVTIEAKSSIANWRQYIFEAVSHKRFAHRAYFAFAFGSDEPTLSAIPEAESLRQYAERFSVGVLVVFLPAEVFRKLHEDKNGKVEIKSDEARVEELWPANYEPVRSEDLTGYLSNTLGIETDKSLYEFGRD